MREGVRSDNLLKAMQNGKMFKVVDVMEFADVSFATARSWLYVVLRSKIRIHHYDKHANGKYVPVFAIGTEADAVAPLSIIDKKRLKDPELEKRYQALLKRILKRIAENPSTSRDISDALNLTVVKADRYLRELHSQKKIYVSDYLRHTKAKARTRSLAIYSIGHQPDVTIDTCAFSRDEKKVKRVRPESNPIKHTNCVSTFSEIKKPSLANLLGVVPIEQSSQVK